MSQFAGAGDWLDLSSALSTLNFRVRSGKGVRSQLPERPRGCFAQLTPDPFT